MLILRVAPKDNGEYKVVIENKLGMAESSMMLNVRGDALKSCKNCTFYAHLHFMHINMTVNSDNVKLNDVFLFRVKAAATKKKLKKLP